MWLYVLLSSVVLYLLYRWSRERQEVSNLTSKYVLITGCDTGFGNILARQLDKHGMRVLATCLTQEAAEQLKKVSSERLKTFQLDVTKTETIKAATEWVKQQVGDNGLWGLVNNAGIAIPTALTDWLTINDFHKVINVNLIGLIEVTLSMLGMVKKARGRVVNISSIMGRISFIGGGYTVSKYGVEAFSDNLRRDLRCFGVKVSIIEPGFFKTAIIDVQRVENSLRANWSRVPAETRESYGEAYIDTFWKYQKDLIQSTVSTDVSKVPNCIEHALIAVYPRTRYSPGWDAKFLWIPLSYLPTVISDFLLTYRTPKPAQSI
ncbi:17-beta-hydroxysteroid dehydrogenase type 6 [Latimeria chalumnae]|uniref:Retinol dehydrogenase 16 n=1 Tax=Latimeria chalumnae TaxID=7897 RepID=H3BHI7_LATCH|nr:PREDICTED: retinol dehydrogenase 3-like [Latimeria chalumnae]XP_014353551.1 PREDICTED: retinol dehydrogenase 3-like [Latimeria chalumnae]|eukprot:XP_005986247.1 PREDICTED: retinol dehydrogenase 3-like [Latimeria chalumnae]